MSCHAPFGNRSAAFQDPRKNGTTDWKAGENHEYTVAIICWCFTILINSVKVRTHGMRISHQSELVSREGCKTNKIRKKKKIESKCQPRRVNEGQG